MGSASARRGGLLSCLFSGTAARRESAQSFPLSTRRRVGHRPLGPTGVPACRDPCPVACNTCCRRRSTLKQQQRNVLAYLTAAHEAALRGEAAPSLFPA